MICNNLLFCVTFATPSQIIVQVKARFHYKLSNTLTCDHVAQHPESSYYVPKQTLYRNSCSESDYFKLLNQQTHLVSNIWRECVANTVLVLYWSHGG